MLCKVHTSVWILVFDGHRDADAESHSYFLLCFAIRCAVPNELSVRCLYFFPETAHTSDTSLVNRLRRLHGRRICDSRTYQ